MFKRQCWPKTKDLCAVAVQPVDQGSIKVSGHARRCQAAACTQPQCSRVPAPFSPGRSTQPRAPAAAPRRRSLSRAGRAPPPASPRAAASSSARPPCVPAHRTRTVAARQGWRGAGMQASLHRRRTAAASCSESPPGPARLDMMSRVAAPPACWWQETTLLLVLYGHLHEPLRWPEPSTHGRATRASRRAGQPVRCAVRRCDRCAGAASSRGAVGIRERGWPQRDAAAA